MKDDQPFLTIFTRHLPERVDLLNRCIQSVRQQSCEDYQHMVVEDTSKHYDVHAADSMFSRFKDGIKGRYVYMLDDDDYLIDEDFIGVIRSAAQQECPDVIMVRMERAVKPFNDVLPPRNLWEKRPQPGKVGAPCFIIKANVWKEYCYLFGKPTKGHGDHCLIATLWDEGYKFHWLNRVVVRIDRIGHQEKR